MKRKRYEPGEYSYHHTCFRLEQRYNMSKVTKKEYNDLCRFAKQAKVEVNEGSQQTPQTIRIVQFRGEAVVVVLDDLTGRVTTALPYKPAMEKIEQEA